jgi:hypothetical protein
VKGVCRSENKDRGRTQKKNKQKGRGQLQILGAERKKKKKKKEAWLVIRRRAKGGAKRLVFVLFVWPLGCFGVSAAVSSRCLRNALKMP